MEHEIGVGMKRANLSVAAARHALAGICSTLFLAAVQLAVFAGLATVGLVSYRDLSAGLDFISAPVLAFGAGAAVSVLCYVPMAVAFEFIEHRRRLAVWLPPLSVLFGSTLAAVAAARFLRGHLSLKLLALAGLFGVVFSLGFCLHWLVARSSGRLVKWLRGEPP